MPTEPLPDQQLHELISHFDLLYRRLMVTRPINSNSELELSRQELRVLMLLGSKGTAIMSDLARTTNLALSTATNTIDKLVGKELVERTRLDEDRRIVQVALTEKGLRFCQSVQDYQVEMGRSMLEAL